MILKITENVKMNVGKAVRLERIMNRETKKTVIVPMDHGVSVGPIPGLEDMPSIINKVAEGGANAVVLHKGLVETGRRGYGKDIGLILHLSASTKLARDPNHKVLVTRVEEAIKLGADAVSIHINVGAEDEAEMLMKLGEVARKCEEWGMPLLAMMYPRGKGINEFDVENIKIAARVGAELGADIIKTNFSGDAESFREVVKGCPKPVVIAGGPKVSNELELLEMVKAAIDAGAAGVAIGRNIFQHENPEAMTRAICKIVHHNYDVEEAIKEVKK